MNLATVIDLNIDTSKKKFLTKPDFQAAFNVVTVDKELGQVLHETKSSESLYAVLEEHFHYLADQDYCNLMYLLDVNTYNGLTVFWAKTEKGVSTALDGVEWYKGQLSTSHQLELSKFLVKLFSHPEESLLN